MKKIISFISLLALLVSGCTREEILQNVTPVSGEGRTFTTSFENNESRTYLEDGRFSRWTEGDRISLFDANTLNNQYLFAGDTGDSGGTFFRLSKPEGTGSSLVANYAVYPYSEDVAMTKEGEISVTLPTEQHYAENSYGLGDNTMVAVTEGTDDTFLKFKNVCGAIKLQLFGDDLTVKSITLKGNNGEKIAGKATLTAAYDQAPVVTMADDATGRTMLDCGEKGVKIGSSAEEATAFWIVVPPTAFEKGITIIVKDIAGKMFTKTTDKELVIERNVVKPMAAVEVKSETALVYSTDAEALEGWTEGLFGGEGSYMIGKAHGEDGYMMTVGNILSGETAIVYLDASRQVREIFAGNSIITLGEKTATGMEVSIIEKDGEETKGYIAMNTRSYQSRSADDHSQQVGTIGFVLNMQGMIEGLSDVLKSDVFKGKECFGTLKAAANASTAGINLVKAWSGLDLFATDSMTEKVGQWLDWAQIAVDFSELTVQMFKKPVGVGGPAGACIAAWAGLYAKYLELYDKYIGLYFGNSVATIGEITLDGNKLYIEVKVPGFESWYNIECGVIVAKKSFPSPRFSNEAKTTEVTKDGEYTFAFDLRMDEAYYFRPFLVTKDRTSLWKGFIGDIAGPLVRYGETVQYQTPLREALIKLYQDTNGKKWTHDNNWCSDKPVTEWYGITKREDNQYTLTFDNNNLTGGIDQTFPEGISVDLICYNNHLTLVDLSGCSSIRYLGCYEPDLTTVDLSDCNALESLNLQRCKQLNNLDASNCKKMKYLNCSLTSLTKLNIQNSNALVNLECSYAKLTDLNLSPLKELTYLSCSSNQLTKLDVSHNSKLESLHCGGNNLTSLDVSKCTELSNLNCQANPIKTLEISNHTALKELNCMEIKNGFTLNLNGCTALQSLHAWYCEFSTLKIKDCPALTYSDIGQMKANSVEISGCTSLEGLSLSGEGISSLTISDCSSLTSLGSQKLGSLKVSNCASLASLGIYDSDMSSLDLFDCTSLALLSLSNCNMSSLDLSDYTSLASLSLSNCNMSSLDLSNLTSLNTLEVNSSSISSLDISGCTSLINLNHSMEVNSLNASNCTSLTRLKFNYNQIRSLNVEGCTSLTQLDCYGNQITSLNVEGCTSLSHLDCRNNKINSVIPDWFSQISEFYHDKKYRYWQNWSDLINGYVTHYEANTYGWWYPGEPGKGKHSPD